MKWSFSYNSFVKVSLFNGVHSFGPKTKHYKGTELYYYVFDKLANEYIDV